MSLKLEFCPDFDATFAVEDEFGMLREFQITEDGEEKIFSTNVVWDTESLKKLLQQQGIFRGTVI